MEKRFEIEMLRVERERADDDPQKRGLRTVLFRIRHDTDLFAGINPLIRVEDDVPDDMVVAKAQQRLHRIMHSLAEQTAEWHREER